MKVSTRKYVSALLLRLVLCTQFLCVSTLRAAACDEGEILRCNTSKGEVNLCVAGDTVNFELVVESGKRFSASSTLSSANLVPWIGFGEDVSILSFDMGETRYRLYSSSTYDPQTDGNRLEAGVIEELPPTSMDAHPMKILPCDFPQKADWFNILYDAKTATGQCWDRASESWKDECN